MFMNLIKSNIDSFIYIKTLGREVKICEENKVTLLAHGMLHLFEGIETPKKYDNTTTESGKRNKHRTTKKD